jgi:hypothetical protein
MLDRVLGHPGVPQDFGVLLDPSNVDGHLASLRAAEVAYRGEHADEVAVLERTAAALERPR